MKVLRLLLYDGRDTHGFLSLNSAHRREGREVWLRLGESKPLRRGHRTESKPPQINIQAVTKLSHHYLRRKLSTIKANVYFGYFIPLLGLQLMKDIIYLIVQFTPQFIFRFSVGQIVNLCKGKYLQKYSVFCG